MITYGVVAIHRNNTLWELIKWDVKFRITIVFKVLRCYLTGSHPAPTGDIFPIVVICANSNVALQSTSGTLICQTHIFQTCHMLPFVKFHFRVGDHLQ
jgi:hypothetical protein